MKCEFNDGLKVDYAGSLRITKSDEVNVFVKEGFIPTDIRSSLDEVVRSNSCDALRKVADTVTGKVGNRACIHEGETTGW